MKKAVGRRFKSCRGHWSSQTSSAGISTLKRLKYLNIQQNQRFRCPFGACAPSGILSGSFRISKVTMKKKILFVCRHNRFRSKVAEAFFIKLSKGKFEIKSAGLRKDLMHNYIAKSVHDALMNKKVQVKDESAREINDELIDWADKIVIVADNVPLEIFPKEKTEVWKISDCSEYDLDCIKRVVGEIEERIMEFVKRLNV